jgi:hypothetical protein
MRLANGVLLIALIREYMDGYNLKAILISTGQTVALAWLV